MKGRDIILARSTILFKFLRNDFLRSECFLRTVSGWLAAAFIFNCTMLGAYAEKTDNNAPSASRPWIGFGEEDNVYCGIDTDEKIIALTFDDGPHPRYTAEILDILKEYGIKATFFAVGENVVLYEQLVKRAFLEGHEIGNHTYSHATIKNLDREELICELERTDKEIERVIGIRPTVFRPPEGRCDQNVVSCAKQMDYKVVLWTVDPRDWSSPPVEAVVNNILKNVGYGSVLLCHDYNSNKKSPTPEALRRVIPELLDRGYKFVTVSELIAATRSEK